MSHVRLRGFPKISRMLGLKVWGASGSSEAVLQSLSKVNQVFGSKRNGQFGVRGGSLTIFGSVRRVLDGHGCTTSPLSCPPHVFGRDQSTVQR